MVSMRGKLDSNFWARYLKIYDYVNLLIPYREALTSICEELGDISGKSILDAGCGTGNLSVKLLSRGAAVVGVDRDQKALGLLKQKGKEAGIVQGDLSGSLCLASESVDGIVSNNVIYTIDPAIRSSLFKEFYRILKPNGRIVVANPKRDARMSKILLKAHLGKLISTHGFVGGIFRFIKMLPPIVQMLYYNIRIVMASRSGEFRFMGDGEQRKLLEASGFWEVSQDFEIYGNQAIMNSATKRQKNDAVT